MILLVSPQAAGDRADVRDAPARSPTARGLDCSCRLGNTTDEWHGCQAERDGRKAARWRTHRAMPRVGWHRGIRPTHNRWRAGSGEYPSGRRRVQAQRSSQRWSGQGDLRAEWGDRLPGAELRTVMVTPET